MITHLEPNIRECEVKWVLWSITTNKASGGDGIPLELFQILKDDIVKMLHSIFEQIWKTQQWPKTGKGHFSFQSQRKGMPKNVHYCTIAVIWHTSKVMLKILQARLQQYVNCEIPDVEAGFRPRQRNQRSNCQHLLDHRKSESFRKTSTALLTMPKPLTVWISTNCGKFFKRWKYQTTWPASWKSCMQVR